MDKNIEILSQQDILAEYKNQLNALKMEVNQNKKISYDDVKTLIDWLPQTYKEAYKAQIEELETKLSSNETISSKDISFLFDIFENLEKHQLSQEQLKAINEALSQVKKTKSQLTILKSTIAENSKIKEIEEKISKYKKKLIHLSWEHPIWTKVLISMLPDNLKTFFVKKESKINVGWDWMFWEIKAMVEQVKQVINNFLVPLLAIFFDFIAPKEIKQLYAEMIDDFSTIKPELLTKVWTGSMVEVTEKVKNVKDVSIEKLDQAKKIVEKFLYNKFSNVLDLSWNKEKKLRVIIKNWVSNIVKNPETKSTITNIADKLKDPDKFTLKDWLSLVGVWVSEIFALIKDLYKNDLIDLSQIAFNLVKKWGEVVIQTTLFFPKLIGLNLWEIKLEDFYKYIKNSELDQQSKEMFLVMIYRALVLPPFSVLQHIAALPGYVLAWLANLWQDVTKWKVFFDTLRGGIDEQLKFLSKIEDELTWRKWNIYTALRQAYNEYKKTIIVSTAIAQSYTIDEAKNLVNELWGEQYLHDSDVKKLLTEKSFEKKQESLLEFIGKGKATVEAKLLSANSAFKTELMKKLKKEIGWVFWHTNLFVEANKKLQATLDAYRNVFKQPTFSYTFRKLEEFFRNVNYARLAGSNVEILDLAHLTKDPNSIRDFLKDLQIFAKHSPDVIRFIFRNIPVVMLADSVIEWASKKPPTEAAKAVLTAFMELIPIVGPITFISTKETVTNFDKWLTAVWLGLDGWFVVRTLKSNPGNLLKLAVLPFEDASRFIGTSIDIIWRYIPKTWRFIGGIELLKTPSWKIALWAALLTIMYGMYNIMVSDDLSSDEKQVLDNFINQAKTNPNKINEFIVENWWAYNNKFKTALLQAMIGRYLGLTPHMLEKYLENIDVDGKEIKIELNTDADFIKQRLPLVVGALKNFGKETSTKVILKVDWHNILTA